jgi:hypothetical protein
VAGEQQRRHRFYASRVSLGHVLWIGGGQGAGKTSVARTIAHRHGLRVYHVDARGWAHVEQAEGGGYPAMTVFAAKSLDERWVEQEPPVMVEEFLAYSRDRFRMIVDDLRALPTRPGIVAEGPQLLPALVAPLLVRPDAAVWLLPTRRLQHELLDARPSSLPELTSDAERTRRNMLERNVLLATALREDADARGFPVVEVGGYDRLVDAVEARLGALADVPRVPDVRDVRRDENLVVADQIRRYYASPEAPPGAAVPSYPFACECRRVGCMETVELSVPAFAELVAAGSFVSAH